MKKLVQQYKGASNFLNRRRFLNFTGKAVTGAAIYSLAPSLVLGNNFPKNETHITLLHTNDMHSRIDPFPSNDRKYPGQGGVAKRATILQNIRAKNPNTLLVDCGDILQGTPYFNFYDGELEFKLMDELGYQAATIGNHDFDAGIDRLAQLMKGANFPMLNTNYNFDDTPLNGLVKPYNIYQFEEVKIGVLGVGLELDGLVPPKLFGATQYHNPVEKANETAAILKNDLGCDLVIVLSHLGYKYDSNKVSDVVLAENSKYIDVILGGHTHTFMDVPDVVKNRNDEPVIINQVGWAGICIGRLDFYFSKTKKNKRLISETIEVS